MQKKESQGGVSIRLFEAWEARRDGEPLPKLHSVKAKWLLALLVLKHGQEIERQWLAEQLWPESLPSDARNNLSQNLRSLIAALGKQAACIERPAKSALRFSSRGADVDVIAFDRAIQKGDSEALESAVALYRGPLLEECDEPWILPYRQQREAACLNALETLAANALASGNLERAEALLKRGMAINPLHESLHRALMQAYAQQGKYEAATSHYKRLSNLLYEQYARSLPEQATVALFQGIQKQEKEKAKFKPIPMPETSGASPPCHLPLPLTSLVGREGDLNALQADLLQYRLVTLPGMGGVGKTRLAIEAARESLPYFPDGAWFVDLSGLTRPDLVPQETARALHLRQEGSLSWEETLTHALHPKQALLVLDNCEHLLPACARLAQELLNACPHLKILATSRERLHVNGERCRPVAPLACPPAKAALAAVRESPAARLFAERAEAGNPAFDLTPDNAAAVARIVRRLDGIPLALELAAALADFLSPAEIAAELEGRFPRLEGAAASGPQRHRTLLAMMDWSYDLLDADERALFRRLSVFAGGFTREAAQAVCAGEGLEDWWIERKGLPALAGKSLVIADTQSTPTRCRLLETVREYAHRRLAQEGEVSYWRRKHRDYFARFVAQAQPHWTGAQQAEWLERTEAEHENIRAALEGTEQPDETIAEEARAADIQIALRMAGRLGRFWQIRGYFAEGRKHLETLLARPEAAPPTVERADALTWAGFLAQFQGDNAAAQPLCEESLTLSSRLGDRRGEAGALGTLGVIAANQGQFRQSRRFYEDSLRKAREAGDTVGIAGTLGYCGLLLLNLGLFDEAEPLFEESLRLRRERNDRWGVAASLNNLGLLARNRKQPENARRFLEESLRLRRALGDRRNIAITLNLLGLAACDAGDFEAAAAHLAESRQIANAIGDRRSLAYALEAFAHLAQRQGDAERAVTLYSAADACRKTSSMPLPPFEAERQKQERDSLRAAIGEEAFRKAWEAGNPLDLLHKSSR